MAFEDRGRRGTRRVPIPIRDFNFPAEQRRRSLLVIATQTPDAILIAIGDSNDPCLMRRKIDLKRQFVPLPSLSRSSTWEGSSSVCSVDASCSNVLASLTVTIRAPGVKSGASPRNWAMGMTISAAFRGWSPGLETTTFDGFDFLGALRWECAESRNDRQHRQASLMHKTPIFSSCGKERKTNASQGKVIFSARRKKSITSDSSIAGCTVLHAAAHHNVSPA